MSLSSRMESLRDRHASLEARISDEDLRPRPDDEEIGRLKRKKLKLKEEIDRIASARSAH